MTSSVVKTDPRFSKNQKRPAHFKFFFVVLCAGMLSILVNTILFAKTHEEKVHDLSHAISCGNKSLQSKATNLIKSCEFIVSQEDNEQLKIFINNSTTIKRPINSRLLVSSQHSHFERHFMSGAIQQSTESLAATITVNNASELLEALTNATGGETILLASGDYGILDLYDARQPFVKFSSEVTIASADPENPAVISQMSLRGVDNLTFDSIKFDYQAEPGAPDYYKPFEVRDSQNITIKNSTFDGDLAEGLGAPLDGYGTGFGLAVNYSNGITIENNEFSHFTRGGVFSNVDDLTITGNEVHEIRSDGFDFAQVNNVLVEQNHFHSFRAAEGSGDHMDMLQLWTTGTSAPSTNFTISGNFFDSGDGDATQSIFMRNGLVDSGTAGEEMFYQNITIENNVIYNAHSHGITVGETDGLIIRNNTILQNPDSGTELLVTVPTINVSAESKDVLVENNIVPRLSTADTGEAIFKNNLVVQTINPEGENYVGDLFVNALAGDSAELIDLQALPGGKIEQMGVGAELTQFGSTFGINGFIDNEAKTGLNLLTHEFSASLLNEFDSYIDLQGTTVSWDFGDGTMATGLNHVHNFADAGEYDVTAKITFSDGREVDLQKTIVVESPIALHDNFETAASQENDGIAARLAGSAEIVSHGDGQAVRLNGDTVAYETSSAIANNAEYTLLVDFKKDTGEENSSGRLINYSGSFVVNVESNGLVIALITNQGTTWLRTGDIGLNDDDWHSLAFTFSGNDGNAIVYVDGEEVARAEGLEGALQEGSAKQKLYLGNPWGEGFDGLVDNVAFVRGAISAEAAAQGASAIDAIATPDSDVPTDDTGTEEPSIEPNKINGTEGNETINGTVGDDEIRGEGGQDKIFAGDGDDIVYLGDANWGRAHGETGNDTLYGGTASDTLFGGDGNDTLNGGAGTDKLFGGAGDDQLIGGTGRDWLYGEDGNDTLVASDADYNYLDGGTGNDELFGGSGRDSLFGGDGNDVLTGGGGKDSLTGGAGEDKFVFTAGNGNSRVLDFDVNEDTLVLQNLRFETVEEVHSSVFMNHGDLILDLDGPNTQFSWSTSNFVRIEGMSLEDFLSADIDLVA